MKKTFIPSAQQQRVFDFDGKKMVISASAGSGKTTTMIEYISRLIESGQSVKRMLVLTFTKAAASEMKDKLMLSLIGRSENAFIQNQIDELLTSDISTIHSFLEKLLKRNISQFPFLEGFKILDEQQTSLLMEEAFDEAERKLKEDDFESYLNLFLTTRDKKLVKDIVFSIHSFLSSQANRAQVLDELKDYNKTSGAALEYLTNAFKNKIDSILEEIDLFPRDNAKVDGYLNLIREIIASAKGNTLRESAKIICSANFPKQPILKDYDKRDDVVEIKLLAQDLKKFAEKLNPDVDIVWDGGDNDKLCKTIFDLYQLFDQAFTNLKIRLNALDFNDLEKRSEQLLDDEILLNELQESYDFVFIDEYQDTNPVQEKIVKLISEGGKFIAIGDPKQGIYAFRNATSKIILKDSHDFDQLKDGQTTYLSENFRSDKKIIDFVNHVFSKIMTNKTSGIDYKTSSYLIGNKENERADQPAVQILVAQKQKRVKKEIVENYDIYKDPLESDDSSLLEAKIVAAKVDKLLASEFVDPKTGLKRRVQPSDIAILSRSRNEIVSAVMNELSKMEVPFVSTLRTDLNSKAHTQLVISLLSLCYDMTSDIALASYLFSPLSLISMDKLVLLSSESKDSFANKVLLSQDEEIQAAIKRLNKFKTDCMFLGAKEALEKLFIEREYFVYLKTKLGDNALAETESLLEIIGNFENDKDVPELVSYLQSSISFSNVSGQNAITISSVHASKGLEYPIVIFVGNGKSMVRNETSLFKLDQEFGLALNHYDKVRWERFSSLNLIAAREKSSLKERVNELMVLYVALTRAKSHLIITGTMDADKVEEFSEDKFNKFPNFMSLILSTAPEKSGADVQIIDEVIDVKNTIEKIKVSQIDMGDLKQKIDDYLNFEYPYLAETKIKQKSSVTELAHAGEEFNFSNSFFADVGTAYHEALRLIDFENAQNEEQIKNELISKKMPENYLNLVDFSLIMENINLIKPLIKNKKIIKEKQFTMRVSLENVNYLVQGTIDLFLKGDKNILIDYKYTGENNPKNIIKRYSKQLDLYKKAIEESEKIRIDEIYLISIKNKKIIKY